MTPAEVTPAVRDDLTRIEGIGPKLAALLQAAGFNTFAELANASPDSIRGVLVGADGNFAMHDPTTWPQQAQLAADGQWDELQRWQDQLDGGVAVTPDDLTQVEGIGPKISEVLQEAGINSFAALAGTAADAIQEILTANHLSSHDPSTWPAQARLAAEGQWDKLKEWQDQLQGGVE